MHMRDRSVLDKAISSSLCAALLVTAPGLPFYRAFAQFNTPGVPVTAPTAGVGAIPLLGRTRTQGGSMDPAFSGAGVNPLEQKSLVGRPLRYSGAGGSDNAVAGQLERVTEQRAADAQGAPAIVPERRPAGLQSPGLPLTTNVGEPTLLESPQGAPAVPVSGVDSRAARGGESGPSLPSSAEAGPADAGASPGTPAPAAERSGAPLASGVTWRREDSKGPVAQATKKVAQRIRELKELFQARRGPDAGTGEGLGAGGVESRSKGLDVRDGLALDKDFQAGYEIAKNWAPGETRAVDFSPAPFWAAAVPPAKARWEARKENFHKGLATGVAERTGDWRDLVGFYRGLTQGEPIERILHGFFPQAPANGPPQDSGALASGIDSAVPVPPAHSAPTGPSAPSKHNSVWWFLGGLLVAQIGIESLGIAMPLLMRERFGGFSAMAQIAVFSSLAGMVGRLVGGAVADKFGLKTTYVASTLVRLASISLLIAYLMQAAFLPAAMFTLPAFWVLTTFYAFNGFMGGISVTAEMTLPQAMLGQNRAVLERFFALEQWLMEIVGVAGPKLGGKVIQHHGFIPALVIYPVTLAVAIGLFIFGIRLPAKQAPAEDVPVFKASKIDSKPLLERLGRAHGKVDALILEALGLSAEDLPDPKDAEKVKAFAPRALEAMNAVARRPDLHRFVSYADLRLYPKTSKLRDKVGYAEAFGGPIDPEDLRTLNRNLLAALYPGVVLKQPGFFKKIGAGAAIVFKHPVMRTAFLGYTVYMIINPLLYSIVGPAFGIFMAGGDEKLGADVASYITSLYSLGGLFGGLIMWRESTLIHEAKEAAEKPVEAAPAKSRFDRVKRAWKWAIGRMDAVLLKAYLGKWIGEAKADGKFTDDDEKDVLKKSTLLWMMLGTIGMAAFLTMLIPTPYVAYAAMIPFGIAQVIATLKLRTIVMSEAPKEDQAKVNGFMGAASIGLVALSLNLVGKLFDVFQGATPFLYFNGGLGVLAVLYVLLTRALRKHTSTQMPTLKQVAYVAGTLALALALGAAGVYAVYAGTVHVILPYVLGPIASFLQTTVLF